QVSPGTVERGADRFAHRPVVAAIVGIDLPARRRGPKTALSAMLEVARHQLGERLFGVAQVASVSQDLLQPYLVGANDDVADVSSAQVQARALPRGLRSAGVQPEVVPQDRGDLRSRVGGPFALRACPDEPAKLSEPLD